jgi:hypothetical protein
VQQEDRERLGADALARQRWDDGVLEERVQLVDVDGAEQAVAAADGPCRGPQPAGTLIVIAGSVVTVSLLWNPGLIPVGLANFQNSARWKASMYCPVPIDVPPNFQDWLTKTGDFCVRASALAPGSQLSTLVGFQLSPFENFMITGMSTALTVVDGLVTWIAGFLPTIV